MNLLTYARLHGLDDPARRVEDALDLVELSDRAGDLAGKLSKGLKQRLAIARALIHRPPVVLLDEPTSGLDPASARHIRDLILKLRQDQRAVLVSTHNLAEAEELSDRIAVLKTRLLALDAPATLRNAMSGAKVNIDVEGDAVTLDRCGESPLAMPSRRVHVSASRVPDLSVVPDLVAALVSAGTRSRARAAGSTHARRGVSRSWSEPSHDERNRIVVAARQRAGAEGRRGARPQPRRDSARR